MLDIFPSILDIYESVIKYFNTSTKLENLLFLIVTLWSYSQEGKNVFVALLKTRRADRDIFSE